MKQIGGKIGGLKRDLRDRTARKWLIALAYAPQATEDRQTRSASKRADRGAEFRSGTGDHSRMEKTDGDLRNNHVFFIS
jgi:hypothetical protein